MWSTEKHCFVRKERAQFRKSNEIQIINRLIPDSIYTALRIVGLNLKEANTKESHCKVLMNTIFTRKVKIILFHVPLLLQILGLIFQAEHPTFVISTFVDLFCFLIPFNLFLYRRKKIISCLKNLARIPCDGHHATRKSDNATQLLRIVIANVSVYFICSVIVSSIDLIEIYPVTGTSETVKIILNYVTNVYYCMFACVGIPAHVILFVHMSSLIYERLLSMKNRLNNLIKEDKNIYGLITQERIIFCRLQQVVSTVDSVFNDVLLVWIVKIITRSCLSTLDLLTLSWTEDSTQVIVLLDTIFDVVHLFVVCHFGGKIVDGKDEIIKSLIYNSGKHITQADHSQNEMHFFVSIVGHSRFFLTVAKISLLNRSFALTILGILISYIVIIYQFASK